MIRILVAAFLFPTIGVAQSCQYSDLITYSAEQVLEVRPELPGLSKRSVGADAAYFLIHYAKDSDDQAERILAELLTNKVRGADDLALSYRIARHGIEAGLARFDTDPSAILERTMPSALRAILLVDHGKHYFDLSQQVPRNKRYYFLRTAALVADQSDQFKRNLAKNAEAAGELVLAAHLLANLADTDAISKLYQRHPAEVKLLKAARPLHAGVDNRPEDGPPELSTADKKGLRMMRAMLLSQYGQALGLYLNQTGRENSVFFAAERLRQEVETGKLSKFDHERSWLLIADALIFLDGPGRVTLALNSFAPPGGKVLADEPRMDVATDRMRVVQTLLPMVRDKVATIPKQPLLLSDFDWDTWLTTAKLLLNKDWLQNIKDVTQTKIAVTLLRKAERYEEAIRLSAQLPVKNRILFYQRLLRDLDLRCDGRAAYAHVNFVNPGGILYRFEQTARE